MRPNHKPCPKCGKEMHRQSTMCWECHKATIARPENKITRQCAVCGKDFTTHKAQIKRGAGKYCSRSCASSGSPARKKTQPKVTCHVCGKGFRKHKSEMRKNAGDLHFCSPGCWYEHNQRENHAQWEGGQHERMNPEYRVWRKAVLERDHYFCRVCHRRDNLEVHHIKRFATHPEQRWEVDNGLTLCHDCHVMFRNCEEEHEFELSFIANLHFEVWYV